MISAHEKDKILLRVQVALCNTAEREDNDILSNCASELAARLESIDTAFGITLKDISAADYQLMQYALIHYSD